MNLELFTKTDSGRPIPPLFPPTTLISFKMSNTIQVVIPVLDLMIGQIVLAKAGNRDEYRPVETPLTFSSTPIEVAKAIFNQTGCDWLYLADIDSFAGANPNWNVYNQLLDQGFGLWIDAHWMIGDRFAQITEKIENRERLRIILSSEAMSSLDQFSKFDELIAKDIVPIFSLDRMSSETITQPGELAELTPLELIQAAYDHGVRNLIVLDLESVGTMQGAGRLEDGSGPMIQEIKSQLSDMVLISGGGVGEISDVHTFLDIGCQHVLVASAIHQRKITPDDVENALSVSRGT